MDSRFCVKYVQHALQNHLENYHEFDNFDTIKGLSGKRVSAHDAGSVMLVDPRHSSMTTLKLTIVSAKSSLSFSESLPKTRDRWDSSRYRRVTLVPVDLLFD